MKASKLIKALQESDQYKNLSPRTLTATKEGDPTKVHLNRIYIVSDDGSAIGWGFDGHPKYMAEKVAKLLGVSCFYRIMSEQTHPEVEPVVERVMVGLATIIALHNN